MGEIQELLDFQATGALELTEVTELAEFERLLKQIQDAQSPQGITPAAPKAKQSRKADEISTTPARIESELASDPASSSTIKPPRPVRRRIRMGANACLIAQAAHATIVPLLLLSLIV